MPFSASLRRIAVQAARDTGYLALGLLTSTLAGCVWVTGLSLSLSLVIFVVGLPVIVGAAIVFRWTAELDRRNTAWFVRRPVRARYREPGTRPSGRCSHRRSRDPQTWRDLVWLVVHSVLGFAFGCIGLGLVAADRRRRDAARRGTGRCPTAPTRESGTPTGSGEAFALALLAVPLAVLTVLALRGMAIAREPARGEPAGRR